MWMILLSNANSLAINHYCQSHSWECFIRKTLKEQYPSSTNILRYFQKLLAFSLAYTQMGSEASSFFTRRVSNVTIFIYCSQLINLHSYDPQKTAKRGRIDLQSSFFFFVAFVRKSKMVNWIKRSNAQKLFCLDGLL